MVRHDPISGMTESRFRVFPVIGPDGNLLMTELPEWHFDDQANDLQALMDASDSEDEEEAGSGPRPRATALQPDGAYGTRTQPSCVVSWFPRRRWLRRRTLWCDMTLYPE